ncbi:hypothetical protein HYPSUDRAFT_204573 [Hypholoma sublateritium FD-334 SS-4]|uniref:Tc1-like transposase DDE domain-containing protein n=1 Tax=Hypholoma sublateritium (strain FD-334 SS-4) TaxID=945553 RepID=A0A0D2NKX9_HYPSF|nr:hypothetical protein HYPSUDRAFT_204573 [Hypholoma sublateritium FD-334 SS-4]
MSLEPVVESEEALEYSDKGQPGPDQEDREHQDIKDKASSEQEDDGDLEESDFESDHEWKGLTSTELAKRLVLLSCRNNGEPDDADWIPPSLQKKLKRERPKTYAKGPAVMSKSDRTQRRYAKDYKNQTRIDQFMERRPSGAASSSQIPQVRRVSDRSLSSSESTNSVKEIYTLSDSDLSDGDTAAAPASTRASESRDHSREVSDGTPGPSNQAGLTDEVDGDLELEHGQPHDVPDLETTAADRETWEEELEQDIASQPVEIKDWETLRAQIKSDLKKNSRNLPLSHINKLIIIINFATLRIKGRSRIDASLEIAAQWHERDGIWFSRQIRALARHYQIFEQLPAENRGGVRSARTLLQDERVKKRVLDYLQSLPTGKVTPKRLQEAVNSEILPDLGITPKKPIGTRTARRWLIKLGWRYTQVRKGVYMDGHERADVVEYRQQIFLPLMAQFEARMVHYEGPELTRVAPNLAPGEREIIPNFHDESSFHGNEEVRSLWLRKDEQPLRKKGRGRLIHVSAFINPETGRLILLDADGNTIRDSTKIIFPGSGGDAWWDCEQLLKQMEDAIQIFEAAHPGKQSLFIFDQSSAHASLPPDALKAFEMNKSDGGKQRRQRDTVIPDNNPAVEHRGEVQKMTNPDGTPKGLQRVLDERGFQTRGLRAKCTPVCPFESQNCCLARLLSQQDDFKNQPSQLETFIKSRGHECIFLPKFHCELNPIEMYWGWCKYRYREVEKKTFQDAKDAV